VLSLFSGDADKVSQSYAELKQQTTLLQGISVYFQKISEYYGEEFLNMYTKEDFLRDYPPKKEYSFAFPWEKEYHEKAIQKAIQQDKLETARKMLAKGLQIPLISEITGLSEHDILILKAE
jgi:predicted transposase/invertase (TIGR01784 family)